jgi:hypothetical protein
VLANGPNGHNPTPSRVRNGTRRLGRGVVTRRPVRDLYGIEASKSRTDLSWPWQVDEWVMASVRDEPLEGEMRRAIVAALRAVPGAEAVQEGDRELWLLGGAPSGEALVLAAASVVDSFAERVRAYHATSDFF